jgi:hypothetical protein
MSKLLSLIITADTRKGFNNESISVGEFENGQPNGTRSVDFLLEGVLQKINFFRGYDIQVVLFIDQHEQIPDRLFMQICNIVHACGNNSKVICKPHDRTQYRWNDKIYIEALKLAEGDYVVKFDADCNAYRSNECDIVDAYMDLLDEGYKYICQPKHPEQKEKWGFASTQFFVCKRETLDLPLIEQSLYTPLKGKHNPCLEFTLAILAGEDNVLYPPRDNDSYMIFCWWKYESGLLKKLNEMLYPEVKEFILKSGITATSW